ncbi:MAG: transposase [Kiloniellaceae bacterium]
MADQGKRRRRNYSKAFKRRVVAETLEPGASVAAVAHRHGLNANMVFLWRGDPRFGPGRETTAILPVEVKPGDVPATSESVSVSSVGLVETTLESYVRALQLQSCLLSAHFSQRHLTHQSGRPMNLPPQVHRDQDFQRIRCSFLSDVNLLKPNRLSELLQRARLG